METVLPVVWFILIAVLWIGYLFLEGFDLGVGMHMVVSARSNDERRVMLNTIGPFWDGNEVWLLTAGGATFAAFPFWYASLFSALYLPLVLVLIGLIFRAVAIEYAGKGKSETWRLFWDRAMGIGSFVAAFGIGAGLALTTVGLPLDANGDRQGGPFVWLNGVAILGGLAVIGFCLAHASTFLALKTDGVVRERMGRFSATVAPIALLPIVLWVLLIQFLNGHWALLLVVAVAAVAGVWGWLSARAGKEGRAFLGYGVLLVAGAASIFANVFPNVLPSTLNSAWNLTVWNASSSTYTLGVMTIVAAFGVPIVLAYQVWSYWVFRRRISADHLPESHPVVAAVRAR